MNYGFPVDTIFLVTGGAGFIGSNICEVLLSSGYKVRVLDNFASGKKENIEPFMSNERFQLITGDICDFDTCLKASSGVDYILHQAALGSVPKSIDDPVKANEININGTLNMLVSAKENKVKRFVFASSSAVYGDDQNAFKREDTIGKPLSPYAITKFVNEVYAKNFFELFGLQTIGLRYFNVFGVRQDPFSEYAAVIPIFLKSLLEDKAPIIYGDGFQTRDFTYVGNVVEANIRACLADDNACGQVFNIACGEKISLNDLYGQLLRLLDKAIPPIYGPERQGDIKHSCADTGKAEEILKFTPKFSFSEGLEASIKWYKEYFKILCC